MRRIFTSTILATCIFLIAQKSSAQTATCKTPTTSGVLSDYRAIAQSQTVPTNITTTFISPIAVYSSTPPASIPFYLTLENTGSGNGTGFSATVTILWGTGGSSSFSCTKNSNLGTPSNSGTTYYFSIQPPVALSQGVNFQIRVALDNGNKPLQITSFGIDKNASTPAGAALPVKFSSLDARAANNAVSLKWNVATEENVNGYEIERSADGRNYSKIGFVAADGQSSYSFVDSKAISIAYYRIKSVDKDGKYGYSTIAMVKAGNSMIVLKAFPTPFIKNVSIQHPSAAAGSSITVSSEDGRIVKSIVPAAGTQQTDIVLSSAKAGLYLVRYVSGSGEVETLKILKQQ